MLCSATLSAQSTWIVDAVNGAGAHFTDLPPAVAAAADGDLILVRYGLYSPITTGKALTILGQFGAAVRSEPNEPAISVAGLPAGKVFRAAQLAIAPRANGPVAFVAVSSSQGTVHLEGIEASGAFSFPPAQGTIVVLGALATIVDCGRTSAISVVAGSGARLAIVHSTLSGRSAFLAQRVIGWPSEPALTVGASATVDVADCTLTGGAAATLSGVVADGAPAVAVSSGTVRLRGGAAGRVVAGAGVSGSLPTSAIAGLGQADIDSSIALSASGGAPLVESTVRATFGSVPGLSVTGNALGGRVAFSHRGAPGQPAALVVGPLGPVQVLPFGELFVDLAAAVALPAILADGVGLASWSLPLPSNPALTGFALHGQVGSLTVPGALVLSNLATAILR